MARLVWLTSQFRFEIINDIYTFYKANNANVSVIIAKMILIEK